MQKTKKVGPIHREKRQLIETVPVETQTLDLLDKEFQSAILDMAKELKETMSKELKEIMRISYQVENTSEDTKRNQIEILELKSSITEMKNSVQGINSRSEQAKARISKSEDRSIEIIHSEEKKEKRMTINDESLGDV